MSLYLFPLSLFQAPPIGGIRRIRFVPRNPRHGNRCHLKCVPQPIAVEVFVTLLATQDRLKPRKVLRYELNKILAPGTGT